MSQTGLDHAAIRREADSRVVASKILHSVRNLQNEKEGGSDGDRIVGCSS